MKNRILIVMCLLAAFSFSARAGLNDGLVAYYPFDGNLDDESGNGNAALANGVVTFQAGRINQAVSFSQSWLQIPNFLNNLQSFSISLWVNEQGMTNAGPGDAESGGEAYIWFGDNDIGWGGIASWGGAWAGVGDTNVAIVASVDTVANQYVDLVEPKSEWRNHWHHIVMTYDSQQGIRNLFIDGNFINQRTTSKVPLVGLGAIASHTWYYGQNRNYRFLGLIDDVRIYNRALSASEVQQLYSLPDIGPAPAPPIVVQTNRTPSSTELGVQTSGSFKVFTNGVFQTNILLNPNLMTIVLTHGWNDSSDTWPSNMASQFVAAGISANLVAWDWRADAKQTFPQTALLKTPAQGSALGTNLLAALGAGYNQPIHFIGHSFGTEVNAAAATCLHQNGFAPSKIQMTLFDEAEIANDLRIVSPTTWNLGWIKPLPETNTFAYADNYVSLVGELQNNASTVNVILTEDQPANFFFSANDLWNALVTYHAVPCQWYGQTITNSTGSVLGNIWSFERNSNFTSPTGGTYFEQQGNGLSLSQISPVAAIALRQLNSLAFERDIGLFLTLKGVGIPVQVAGDVTANVVDAVLNDSTPAYVTTPATIGISSYAPATPDFWSPQLILQTQPFSLPTPQVSSQPHPLGNPQSMSSNSPAYAWLPMTIPTNGTSLSFDFMVQGNGANDSFAAAVNGTNVFSLPLSLLQTNVVMNSGPIDVSACAGTNIELFVGIVGGTSTNASVSVSGVRIYTTMPPSLQAQPSGGNLALSWPLSAQNFSVQTTTNLADPNSWVTLTNAPAIVNLQNTVTNSNSGGAQFYRLKK